MVYPVTKKSELEGAGCGSGRRSRATAVAGWEKERGREWALTENGNFTKCCRATTGLDSRSKHLELSP